MGLWRSHRIRQAGRYAKASYRLEVASHRLAVEEANRSRQIDAVRLQWIRAQNRVALDAELRRLAPPRPDLPALEDSRS